MKQLLIYAVLIAVIGFGMGAYTYTLVRDLNHTSFMLGCLNIQGMSIEDCKQAAKTR